MVDWPLAAAIVVMFRREGTGSVFSRVKAGTMKIKRLARRMMRSGLGCEARGYEVAAACTAGCKAMTAGYE